MFLVYPSEGYSKSHIAMLYVPGLLDISEPFPKLFQSSIRARARPRMYALLIRWWPCTLQFSIDPRMDKNKECSLSRAAAR